MFVKFIPGINAELSGIYLLPIGQMEICSFVSLHKLLIHSLLISSIPPVDDICPIGDRGRTYRAFFRRVARAECTADRDIEVGSVGIGVQGKNRRRGDARTADRLTAIARKRTGTRDVVYSINLCSASLTARIGSPGSIGREIHLSREYGGLGQAFFPASG